GGAAAHDPGDIGGAGAGRALRGVRAGLAVGEQPGTYTRRGVTTVAARRLDQGAVLAALRGAPRARRGGAFTLDTQRAIHRTERAGACRGAAHGRTCHRGNASARRAVGRYLARAAI